MSNPTPEPYDPIVLIGARHPCFLVGETHTRNIRVAAHGEQPSWRVTIGLNGKWNHGAEDIILLMLAPDNAVNIAHSLIEAALACGRDQAVLDEVESIARELWREP